MEAWPLILCCLVRVRLEECKLNSVFTLALILLHASAGAQVDGSYVARTLNGRGVPADLRLPATGGDFRLFRLDEGVLRLDRSGSFTLHFRYYHQLVRRG